MAMSSKDSAKFGAYRAVNTVTQDEILNSAEHQDIINNALQRLWQYDGLYPSETDALREERMDLTGPTEGEAYELSVYFKQLYPDIEGTGWTVIFTVYNRMKDLFNDSPTEEVAKVVNESSEININNSFKEKEDINMSENETVKELEQLQKELQQDIGSDVTVGTSGSLPVTPKDDAVTMDLARKAVEEQREKRQLFTKNSVIERVVFSKPSARSLVITKEGVTPTGKVSNPVATLRKFRDLFGVDDTKDPVVFNNCHPQDLKAAADIYEILVAAADAAENNSGEGPDVELNESKSTGSVAGVLLKTDSETAYKTMKDLRQILMEKSLGVVDTSSGIAQFRICEVKARNASKSKTIDGKKNQAKAKTSFDGVVVVRIAHRQQLLEHPEMIEYVTSVDASKPGVMASGVKSKLSARYMPPAKDKNDSVRYRTYRINLKALQQATQADLEHFNNVFTVSSGMGIGGTKAYNINDQADLDAMAAELSKLIGKAAQVEGAAEIDLVNDIRKQRKEADEANTADMVSAFEGAIA